MIRGTIVNIYNLIPEGVNSINSFYEDLVSSEGFTGEFLNYIIYLTIVPIPFILLYIFYDILNKTDLDEKPMYRPSPKLKYIEGLGFRLEEGTKIDEIPRPNDDTRYKDLAQRIYEQMQVTHTQTGRKWNIYSKLWHSQHCFLHLQNRMQLMAIAREAESVGELDLLGFRLEDQHGRKVLRFKGPTTDPVYATINVYLLVLGKITPEGKRELFAG